jgi:hypothetical protein
MLFKDLFAEIHSASKQFLRTVFTSGKPLDITAEHVTGSLYEAWVKNREFTTDS